MIYKVAICDDEINQCAVLEKVIIEYFKNRAEKCVKYYIKCIKS